MKLQSFERYAAILLLLALVRDVSGASDTHDCWNTADRGASYRGNMTVTNGGKTCQRWDSQSPHKHTRTAEVFTHSGLVNNFCRNPDAEPLGPWCYTTDSEKRWENCPIPKCEFSTPKQSTSVVSIIICNEVALTEAAAVDHPNF
ncbi:plasminogen-like [Styela clava]